MSGNMEVAESLDAEVARMYSGAVQPGESYFYAMTPAGVEEFYDGEGVDETAYDAFVQESAANEAEIATYEAEMGTANTQYHHQGW